MRSGSAVRFGSVAGSQLGLRTRTKLLPSSLVSNMYGPVETTCCLYCVPVSFACGTGIVAGHLREVVEPAERLDELEHDRPVVRGLDRGQAQLVRARVLVRAGVALQVEEVVEVGRAVRERRLVQRPLDGVLDVLAGDRRAVLELDALAQGVGPLRRVGVRGAERSRRGPGRGSRPPAPGADLNIVSDAAVEPGEVPGVGVVGVAPVQGVPVAGVREPDRAALDVGRVVDPVRVGRLARAAPCRRRCRCPSWCSARRTRPGPPRRPRPARAR